MRSRLALVPFGMLLLAVAEIAVFIAVVNAIGALWSLLLLAVTTVAGAVLLRREGIRGWRAFRAAAEAGRPPGPQVSNSLVGLLGAVLLATPGFLSSVIGLLLLVPPTRWAARRGVERATERRVPAAVAGDLFGPRRVRVRRGRPTDEPPAPPPATGPPPAAIEGEVVEGEIVR